MKYRNIIFLTGSNQTNLIKEMINDRESIRGIVLPFKSKHEDRLKPLISFAKKEKILVFRPKKKDLIKILQKLKPSILLSFGYPHLLTKDQLEVAEFNLNIHPSLLPKFRGPNIEWYIIASGAKRSGITVHLIDEGMDSGPIVERCNIRLSNFETIKSYNLKIEKKVFSVLKSALKKIRDPNFKAKKQNERLKTAFPKIRSPEDSEVDSTKSLRRLYNFIRACDPEKFPAYFLVGGQKVGIKLFRIYKSRNKYEI